MPKAECQTGAYLRGADAEDAKALQTALDNGIQYETISAALRRFGVRLPADSMSRHKRGICACDRVAKEHLPAASIAEALSNLEG